MTDLYSFLFQNIAFKSPSHWNPPSPPLRLKFLLPQTAPTPLCAKLNFPHPRLKRPFPFIYSVFRVFSCLPGCTQFRLEVINQTFHNSLPKSSVCVTGVRKIIMERPVNVKLIKYKNKNNISCKRGSFSPSDQPSPPPPTRSS